MSKSEPTGARLLDIATDHVRKHGLERTSVVAVARDAQVSHAAVYRYFASKDALIDAVTGEWHKGSKPSLRAWPMRPIQPTTSSSA